MDVNWMNNGHSGDHHEGCHKDKDKDDDDDNNKNLFQFPDSFRLSADLYSEAPKCKLPNCKLFCGDMVCKSSKESDTTCPMDCNPLVCPSSGSRRFLSRFMQKSGQ